MTTTSPMKTLHNKLSHITLDDIGQWAGNTILSRGKSYIKNVEQLSLTPDDELVAWVYGSKRYTTSVIIQEDGKLFSACSCPYLGSCKHAVAVILAAAQAVKDNIEIPLLNDDSDLATFLFAEDDDEIPDNYEVYDAAFSDLVDQEEVKAILAKKTQKELLELLIGLIQHNPIIGQQILKTKRAVNFDAKKLIASTRKKIIKLTAEPAWSDYWSYENCYIPDFSPITENLNKLLEHKHADAVIELCEELFSRGNEQINESSDDGELVEEIGQCLSIVYVALPQSSLEPAKQLLWTIDHYLEDEFCLLDSLDLFDAPIYHGSHWQEVANILEDRLNSKKGRYQNRHKRSYVINILLDVYGRAGWEERAIPLLEAEVDSCVDCYQILVNKLLEAGETEKAKYWCVQGYKQTNNEWTGIASTLKGKLREIAAEEKRYDMVASYQAHDFFLSPSDKSFSELKKTCEKIKCWSEVRQAAIDFLKTGKLPYKSTKSSGKTAWPLPALEIVPSKNRYGNDNCYPDLDTLIDIAILEKRNDDVVAHYQNMINKNSRWVGIKTKDSVAQAVSNTHSNIALKIWQGIAENLIAEVKPKSYQEASFYLRKMRKVYKKQKNMSEWQNLLQEIRRKHKAKRRLMEVLDNLSEKSLVD